MPLVNRADFPVRYPDTGSPSTMTRRAWLLVVLNLVLPGSAQIVAGNKRLGRVGVISTLAAIVLIVLIVLALQWWPGFMITLASSLLVLWLITGVLVYFAVLWVILTLDTLRLVRFVNVGPRARAWVAAFSALAMVAVSGTAAYGAYVAATANSFISEVFIAADPEPPIDGRYNILLLGTDAYEDREGLRPDSITVVSVDAETGSATMIGLPRDLANVPFAAGSPMAAEYPYGYGAEGCEVGICQLNSIYTETEIYFSHLYPDAAAQGSSPGLEAMMDAASGITGLTMQYFVVIDMAGFQQLIDALGGITIAIDEPVPVFADEFYTEVAYYIGPGVTHLDGWTALDYARSRGGSTDYARMERQRLVQQAIIEQFTPANVLTKFESITDAGVQLVTTNIPQSMLGPLVTLADKTRELPIATLELTPPNVDPLAPDYAYIHELVAQAAPAPAAEEPAAE